MKTWEFQIALACTNKLRRNPPQVSFCDILCCNFTNNSECSCFPSQRSFAYLCYLMALQNHLLCAVILHKPRDQDGGTDQLGKHTSEESIEALQRQVLEYPTHIFTACNMCVKICLIISCFSLPYTLGPMSCIFAFNLIFSGFYVNKYLNN